ncbi:MAG: alkaline phosphatase family protein, partial [Slackia sp.]|nr:alkaline phosphatase family protein [Slackia sp.]
IEAEKEGERRVLVASPKVATYDLQPEMSEPEVADTLAAAIAADEADVYIVNFANCDMVGHTGDIPAAIAAVEAVDAGVGKVVEAIRAKGGFALITADHGNADRMLDADGGPYTAHTTAPVPLILVDDKEDRTLGCALERAAALCDIAPTLLAAIGSDIPEEMTGQSLLRVR